MTGSPGLPSRALPPAATGTSPPRPADRPAPLVPAQVGGEAVLALCGDIDLLTAGDVLEAARRCLRGRPARLLLDLRQVGFCDAAGARALRQARDEAAAAGTDFGLVAPGPVVARVLTLIGAGDLLPAAVPPQPPGARPPGRPAVAGRGSCLGPAGRERSRLVLSRACSRPGGGRDRSGLPPRRPGGPGGAAG